MILTGVHLGVVFNQKERQFTQVAPALEAQFTLQCLLCGVTHQLSTPTVYKLKAGERPYVYIHQITTVIKQTRSCDNCGILSTLPKLDEERLKKALERAITQDFIDYHSKDQPPFLAQRLVERAKLI
jgi:hypothetical protein